MAGCFSMDKWRGKVALVTGASAGIGAAVSVALAKLGLKVAACARRLERLQELKEQLPADCEGDILPLQCDLTKEDDILKMFATIKETWGGVDICINNAGMSMKSRLCDGTVEQWRHMLDVNVVALCLCQQQTIKSIKERKADVGHIININSLAGHRVAELMREVNFYSATKFAVTAVTEGLRREMRDENLNVRVTAVSPGLVETEFLDVFMGKEKSDEVFSNINALKAEDIAQVIVQVLSAPAHVEINDVLMRPTEQKF